MLNKIKIGSYAIGLEYPPMIVAEMSGNHNGSLERALDIVRAVAKSGAHALKLQTYTADTMTLDISEGEFLIKNPNSLWDGRNLYDLYKEAHTPWDWHEPIFELCTKLGIICFSAPFDATAVDFLESLNAPAYKIASFENIDIPLIRKAAQTGKPLIISSGMATEKELDEAVKTAREAGCNDLILLKCTSTYPASPENSNVNTIPHMRERFNCHVGLSDHTLGIGVPLASIPLGAVMIEKHFTLSRDDGGVDSAFSLEPDDLKSLVDESKRAWQSLGNISYGATDAEKPSLVFRRSIYVVKDMAPGEIFTAENLRCIRPGLGLPPRELEALIGKKASKTIKRGTAMKWELTE